MYDIIILEQSLSRASVTLNAYLPVPHLIKSNVHSFIIWVFYFPRRTLNFKLSGHLTRHGSQQEREAHKSARVRFVFVFGNKWLLVCTSGSVLLTSQHFLTNSCFICLYLSGEHVHTNTRFSQNDIRQSN